MGLIINKRLQTKQWVNDY